jgi:hypothetical protein
MNIFYIGQLTAGGTCLDRLQCIKRLGHVVTSFDTHAYLNAGRILLRSFSHRFNVGAYVNKLNYDLICKIHTLKNIDLIWIDKGGWIRPGTLFQLKTALQAKLIHFTPDPAFKRHYSHLFKASLPLYDQCFTTKSFELEDYHSHNAKCVHLVHQAYEKTRFYPRPPVKAYESDVCFIGHFEIHYARRLKAVAKTGVKLAIWGPGWKRYSKMAKWCRTCVKGDGIWGDEYPLALCSAKISLGLLSKKIPETSTTRTFEIPASGTFMLAERTDEHISLFREGKEAEFASSDMEIVKKVKYYLNNVDIRKKIALAGRKRCTESDYSNDSRMSNIFNKLNNSKIE